MGMNREQILDKLLLIDEQMDMLRQPRSLFERDMLAVYGELRRHYLLRLSALGIADGFGCSA